MSPDRTGDAEGLPQRLREAREFLNLSQQFVARQTGIPRSAVSDIERGARRVESTELKNLAELYRMPVDYLLGIQADDSDLAGTPADPTALALARATEKMSAADREQVLRFALFLKNFKRPPRDSDADVG
jgi:transcriptional regulator with XRE-family HTH domain